MDTETLKDSIMTPPVTPAKAKATPLTAPYRKDFSLSSGAKFLGIGKNTLKRAIERGEVKATKNAAGHYTIEGAQVFQHQQNLEADRIQGVSERVDTRIDTSADTGIDTPVLGGSDTSVDTSVRGVPTLVVDTPVIDPENAALKVEVTELRSRIQMMDERYTDYKKMVEQTFKLLPAPIQPDINLSSAAGQGGNFWRNIAALLVVVALAGTALYYKDNIANTVAKFTAANDSAAAAIESEMPQG